MASVRGRGLVRPGPERQALGRTLVMGCPRDPRSVRNRYISFFLVPVYFIPSFLYRYISSFFLIPVYFFLSFLYRYISIGVKHIAAGGSHSLCVTKDGAVFSWGCGADGRLGHGSHSDEMLPRQVRAMASETLRVSAVAAGYAHSILLTELGAAFTCGDNKWGQLGLAEYGHDGHDGDGAGAGNNNGAGNGNGAHPSLSPGTVVSASGCVSVTTPQNKRRSSSSSTTTNELVPRRVMALRPLKVTRIAAGENHTSALSEDHRVFLWGLNTSHQCGDIVCLPPLNLNLNLNLTLTLTLTLTHDPNPKP
jgi:hypothetical protein